MSMLHSSKQKLIFLILLPLFIQNNSTSCENLIRVSQSFKNILDRLETCQPNYPWSDNFIQLSEYLKTESCVIEEELIQQLLDEGIVALDNASSEDLEIRDVLLQIKDDIHRIEVDDNQYSKYNISYLFEDHRDTNEMTSDLGPTGNSEYSKKITRSRGCCCCWGSKGSRGPRGQRGARGATGATGATGPGLLTTYGNFYALMSSDTTSYPDNTDPVPQYSAVEFPRTNITSGIINDTTEFELPAPGIYEITWQVPVDQEGQLQLWLDQGSGATGLAYTVVGRRTGNTQIVGNTLVQTTSASSRVSVRNPNSEALIIPPYERSGETGIGLPVSASITIKRIG